MRSANCRLARAIRTERSFFRPREVNSWCKISRVHSQIKNLKMAKERPTTLVGAGCTAGSGAPRSAGKSRGGGAHLG